MMHSQKKAKLIEGSVPTLLIYLTLPMILGMLGMVAFNLTDTYFVGQLGTMELAAMSFTFPVVMVINSLALGLGMGTSAAVSRAIGQGDQQKAQRLTTDSLLLSVSLVAGCVVIGLLTITPLFRFIGANSDILPLIRRYMLIWYPGMIAVVVPMVGNNAIRATGDTKTPSMIMLLAVVVNILLDPLLIFGIGPFPRLEIAGAALATVCARMVTLSVALWVLSHREKLLSFQRPPLKAILHSWKQILYIGIPSAATNMLLPISAGIVTRLIAAYGPETVAGFGVATRIEMFAMLPAFALTSVLGPFVGQNWGAKKYERVRAGITFCQQCSLCWGLATLAVLSMFGKFIAPIFNANPIVISTAATYFLIVPFGYGALGVLRLSTTALSVLNKPLYSAILTLIQAFLLYIPFAYLGSNVFGLPGIFSAAAGSYIIAALVAYFWLKQYLIADQQRHLAQQAARTPATS